MGVTPYLPLMPCGFANRLPQHILLSLPSSTELEKVLSGLLRRLFAEPALVICPPVRQRQIGGRWRFVQPKLVEPRGEGLRRLGCRGLKLERLSSLVVLLIGAMFLEPDGEVLSFGLVALATCAIEALPGSQTQGCQLPSLDGRRVRCRRLRDGLEPIGTLYSILRPGARSRRKRSLAATTVRGQAYRSVVSQGPPARP